jgi:tRNA(adenine34) deaminase
MTTNHKWVREVKTVSTFPPEGIFTKDAETIARVMATKKVSPKGLGSAIRMIQYFINRAGKNLEPKRKVELEKAKRILRDRMKKQKEHPAARHHASASRRAGK